MTTENSKAKPLVSVIMSSYNNGDMLKEAIRCVLSQTFGDFELILVDDCSTDTSREYIQSIADHRLHYHFLEENMGLGYVRATGIELARADWIAIADGDDYWEPTKLEHQVEIVNKHPKIDVLFGDFINHNWLTNEKISAFEQQKDILSQIRTSEIESGVLLIDDVHAPSLFLKSSFIGNPTILMKKTVIDVIGNFDKKLRTAEDVDFNFRVLYSPVTCAYSTKSVMIRNKIPTGLTGRRSRFNQFLIRALSNVSTFVSKDDLPLYENVIQDRRQGIAVINLREYVLDKDYMNSFIWYIKSLRRPGNILRSVKLLAGLVLPKSYLKSTFR